MNEIIVHTKYGKLRGIQLKEGKAFLGIPYAKPPVGLLRFRPTEPPQAWSGVLDCIKLRAVAPQIIKQRIPVVPEGAIVSEDCLYLNLYTPAIDEKKRPVLVYVHGGAFQKGYGGMGFHAKPYLEKGMVVVNFNYRLGALGFLDFSSYFGKAYEQSGNSGLLDVLMALRWLKDNVAAFGGDPENIILIGQSAGAKIISSLLVMETAKGTFDKAIICSGGVQCIRDKNTATKIAERFVANAGLSEETANKLLYMSWEKLVEAQTDQFAGLNLHTCGPVFDGVNFSGSNALEIIRSGQSRNIPIIVGTNRDEMELYYHAYGFQELDHEMAIKLFGKNAEVVLREYAKIVRDEKFKERFVEFMTEYVYRAGAVKLCEAYKDAGNQKLYLFRNDFDRRPGRAGHASEAQFTMKNFEETAEKTPEYFALADGVVDAFAHFARWGRPDTKLLPHWLPYKEDREMLVWDLKPYRDKSALPQIAKDMPEQIYIL